jgi:2',3'-cyclic-nucleotide 2'-phosphodiesterase (5'-nucleotidase family)
LNCQQREADVVVALADLEADEVRELLSANLDLEVVLGERSVESRRPALIGRTIEASAGSQGRHVGKLVLRVDSRGQVAAFEGTEQVLGGDIADDPDVALLRSQYPQVGRHPG